MCSRGCGPLDAVHLRRAAVPPPQERAEHGTRARDLARLVGPPGPLLGRAGGRGSVRREGPRWGPHARHTGLHRALDAGKHPARRGLEECGPRRARPDRRAARPSAVRQRDRLRGAIALGARRLRAPVRPVFAARHPDHQLPVARASDRGPGAFRGSCPPQPPRRCRARSYGRRRGREASDPSNRG